MSSCSRARPHHAFLQQLVALRVVVAPELGELKPIPLREVVESDLLTVQDPEHLRVHAVGKKRVVGLAPGTGVGAAAAGKSEETGDGRERGGRSKEHTHERHLVLERIGTPTVGIR